MPAPSPFVIPRRFDPRWSLLGRGLRRHTGDRLRAETLQIMLLTGAALACLMGIYAIETAAALVEQDPLTLGVGLAGGGLALVLVGVVGFRPRTVVTAGAEAVTVERGRERMRLPYRALAGLEAVQARLFHRRYRRYAAVRLFRGATTTAPVLLLRRGDRKTVVALGLSAEDRRAFRQHVEEHLGAQRECGRGRQPVGSQAAMTIATDVS